MSAQGQAPRVFISYSWSSPDYQERVLKLAGDLVLDGVDVILDRWHLQPGQDAFKFMERAVTDASVEYVLILCDPTYAAKADGREGGVGAETLIISPKVYSEAAQTKFIPVLMERDAEGRPAIPAYLSGRLWIDLSGAAAEEENYRRLVRRLYGQQELERPPLGRRPAFLDAERAVLLTGRAVAQYEDAVQRGQPQRHGIWSTYLDRLSSAFAAEQPDAGVATDIRAMRQWIDASVSRFRPYRDEFVTAMRMAADFAHEPQPFERLHRFFAQLLAVRAAAPRGGTDREVRTENLAFLMRELFLYAAAILLRAQRFDALARLVSPFHVPDTYPGYPLPSGTGAVCPVGVLDPPFRILTLSELGAGAGELLQSRATIPDVPYQALAEAEVVLSLYSRLTSSVADQGQWRALWHAGSIGVLWALQMLPIAARLRSPSYRDPLIAALGLTSVAQLKDRIATLPESGSFWAGTPWMGRDVLAHDLGL